MKVVELAMLCQFDYPPIWKVIEEQILYNAEYEMMRDIIEMIETVRDSQWFQGENFWHRMMEKIVKMRHMLSCRDIIEIIALYSSQAAKYPKRLEMCKYILDQSKSFIVEEIDSLSLKEILSLIELFRSDMEFKKFLGHNLKDKIVQMPNI